MDGFSELQLSFPINVWDKMTYGDLHEITIDIYFNDHGSPKYIHDAFGASAIDEFRQYLIKEILSKNSADQIWRISHDAFAILHKSTNCDSFQMVYRGISHTILKKTVLISQLRD